MSNGTLAIDVDRIKKKYGAIEAVKLISLTVAPGEIVGLIGADGAGKTSTIKMICGLLAPDAGTIRVSGFDVRKSADEVKTRLGYMPQRFSLYSDLSVAENIRFFADLFKLTESQRAQRVARLYEFSKLGPFQKRRAGQLSGGMKQKLALCCNLIHEPEVMVLDEPTFGVDPVSRRELWDILGDLKKRGSGLLVSTAYMDEAELCDRVYLMHEGQFLCSGETKSLLANFEYQLLELFRDEIDFHVFEQLSSKIAQLTGVHSVNRFGDRLHVAFDRKMGSDRIVAEAEQFGFHSHPTHPVMEDVFVNRVQNNGN